MTPDTERTDMHDQETTATPTSTAGSVESADEACAADGARRRAAIAKLGRMAALSTPALMTLLMSDRASAESPPPDPT